VGISSSLGSSALLPAGLGFRNAVINGDFRINQRGFTSATTSGTYGFDRWVAAHVGGTCTQSAQTFTVGSPAATGFESANFLQFVTASQSATGDFAKVRQFIEDVRTFAGSTVTVSFWAKSVSGTPKVAIELNQGFGTGGSPSAEVNVYGGQVTLSTSWSRYSVTVAVPSISGKTIGTTANTSSLSVDFWTSSGTTYNSRSGSLGIQNTTIQFWGVQVEQNYQPTPFEQRPIGVELALCQRYYVQDAYTDRFTFFVGGDGYMNSNSYSFPVQMRIAPTITLRDNSAVLGQVYAVYGAGSYGGITASATVSNFGFSIIRSGMTLNVAGKAACSFTASAEL